MKIEMGKRYQTRDGRPVRLLCTDKKGEFPVVGVVPYDDGGAEDMEEWTSTGGYYSDQDGDTDLDLVPMLEKVTVNVYRCLDGRVRAVEVPATLANVLEFLGTSELVLP